MSEKTITVAIADDHALLRQGVAAMLSYEADIEVVGEAQDGKQAVELYERVHPDVMIMDISMPVMGGIEASREICKKHPDATILAMTQHESQQFVDALMKSPVSGLISKRAIGQELVQAIRAVLSGNFYIHPVLARMVAANARSDFIQPEDTLTARERDVLERVVRGDTNAHIARSLGLSIKTVEWHRANLMNKLDTHSVADLVRYALDHGIVTDGKADPIDRLD